MSLNKMSIPCTLVVGESRDASREERISQIIAASGSLSITSIAGVSSVLSGSFYNPSQFNIVFLDEKIDLHDLTELAAMHPTIALSSTTRFAYAAYQCGLVDYLLFPFSSERVALCIRKLAPFLGDKLSPDRLGEDVHLNNGKQELVVDPRRLVYVQSLGNYIRLYFNDSSKPELVYSSLKVMESQVQDHGVIQVHKSYLVNPVHFEYREQRTLTYRNIEIPVGRKFQLAVERVMAKKQECLTVSSRH